MQTADRHLDFIEYRLIEVDDKRYEGEPHVILVKLHRTERRVIQDEVASLWEARLEVGAKCVAGPHLSQRILHVAHMGGQFQQGWSDFPHKIKLTPGGILVRQEYRGLRIGTYLQNLVIRWAIDLKVDAVVEKISLIAGDARTADERDRRNRFYEQFGLRFIYEEGTGIERSVGRSIPDLRIAELNTIDKIEGIVEADFDRGVTKLAMDAYTARRDSADNLRALKNTRDFYKEQEVRKALSRRRWVTGLASSVLFAAIWLLWKWRF